MRIVTRFIALSRARMLARQFRDIESSIRALPGRTRARLGTMALKEVGQASRSDFPHLYGTSPQQRYLPWGQGTDVGYTRSRSDNAEVALRGMALWLAVAYHETKDTPHPHLQALHRQLMRVLRELKEVHRKDAALERWMVTA